MRRPQLVRVTSRSIVRVTVTALNMLTSTPTMSTSAKPRTTVVPCQYSQPATRRRRDVRVEDARPGPVEAGLDRRTERLAGADLLLHPLEDEDVGVDRHADARG